MNLFWCNAVSAICLVLLAVYVLYFFCRLFIGTRVKRIRYLRNFKKGKCVIIYLIAVPLYFIGYLYGGEKILEALFQSIARVVNLVVLKFEFTGLSNLIADSKLFELAVYFTFVLVVINAFIFAFSILGERMAYAFTSLKFKLTRKNCLFIFGDCESNLHIYESEKTRQKQLVSNFTAQEGEGFYYKKINYHKYLLPNEYIEDIIKSTKFRDVSVVINYKKEEDNIKICSLIVNQIKKISEKENAVDLMKKLHVYLFGNPSYEAIYFDFLKQASGCLQYLNKYRQIATDFIDKYPFTAFMNDKQLDYSSATVKTGVNINAILVGFGNTNKQIFLTSVANNQFITKENENILLKKVNYHIFDKDIANNKNLNHDYYRMKNELKDCDINNYLPLPEMPANESYHLLNINDNKFYEDVHNVICQNKNDANFIIVAFGSDLENLDMAKKLCEKRDEWGASCTIFVKSREDLISEGALEIKNCFFIGNEQRVVYNIDKITENTITNMATLRNFVYDIEREVKQTKALLSEQDMAKMQEKSIKKWYLKKLPLERESSIYSCLSLRAKLNMLNLDYCDKSDSSRNGITEQEYLAIYAKNDEIEYLKGLCVDNKKIVKYSDTFKPSLRKNLAILEHFRWNSFMISKGFIPATKDMILTEKTFVDGKLEFTNGKNYRLRRHGNLTDFDGLGVYAEMIAARDNSSLTATDVVCYDYQILDDAYWLLDKADKKIYLRNGSESADNQPIG